MIMENPSKEKVFSDDENKKHRRIKDNVYTAREIPEAEKFMQRESTRAVLSAAGAFFLTGSSFGGIHSPLSVAFCAPLGVFESSAAIFGSVLSCIAFGNLKTALPEIFTCLFMLLVKLFSSHRFSVKGGVLLSSLSYLGFGIITALYTGFSVSAAAAVVFRTAVCVFGAYFFERASGASVGEGSPDIVPVYFCMTLIASSICGIDVYIFNPGRILIFIFSMIFAKKYGSAGGAAAGAAGTVAMILANSDFSRSAAFAASAALISGLAAHRGKLWLSMTYLFAAMAAVVIIGLPSGTVNYIADSAFAALLYFIFPERFYAPFIDRTDRREKGERGHISVKLNFSSEILESIGEDISKARKIYESKECEHDIAGHVKAKICKLCKNEDYCNELFSKAPQGSKKNPLDEAAEIILRNGKISESELPPRFSKCVRKPDIVKSLGKELFAEQRRRADERFSFGLCASSLEQLKAQRLSLASLINNNLRYDVSVSCTAADGLREFGLNVKSAAVYYDSMGRAYVEAFISGAEDIPFGKLTDMLSEITGTALDVPLSEKNEEGKNITRIRWCRVPELIADVSIKQQSGSEEKSGDTAGYFYDGFGKLYVIVADGMGSGQRAVEESCMAFSLIKRLIRSDMGAEAAVSYANLLLGGVSGDEMFTTVDICEIDTFSGKCVFYKHGAAPSYLRHGNEIKISENSALPVGILTETSAIPLKYSLWAKDSVVMISDGVKADKEFISEVMMNDASTAEMCAEKILSFGNEKKDKDPRHREDDKTVCAVKLYKN